MSACCLGSLIIRNACGGVGDGDRRAGNVGGSGLTPSALGWPVASPYPPPLPLFVVVVCGVPV